ncbi:hypothetical protein D9M71_391960 [compost metagenome]
MQAAERTHFVQGFGQLFGGQAHQGDVIHRVFAEIAQRRVDRGLADFGGEHFAYAGGEGQGEVAVAAIQFQQIIGAIPERIVRPVEHLLVHRTVGLGERAFRLAVAEGAAADVQLLDHVIVTDDFALALGAADDADVQVRRQFRSRRMPMLVQRTVIAQGDHCVAGQRGQELHLEQLVTQGRTGLPRGLELRHQLVDAQAGNRELFDQDGGAFVFLGKHRVMPLAGLTPQAELGAQAEVFQRRIENGWLRCIERGQQVTQTRDLFFELNGIGLGIKSHALNQPSLITNRIDRITSAGFSSRPRPDISLMAVQEMKPKAMPLAME